MAQKKLSPTDQLQLVRELRDLIVDGWRTKDIFKFTKNQYDISEPQTKRYLQKARAEFKQIDNKVKGQLRSKYRERLEKMYNNAMFVQKDMDLALKVQRELNRLVEADDETPQMPDLRVIFQQEPDKDD